MSISDFTNNALSKPIALYAQLLKIRGENSFRISVYEKAAEQIKHHPEPIYFDVKENNKIKIEGIGKKILEILDSIIQTGTFPDLEEEKKHTPVSLLVISKLAGIGPKKLEIIWKEFGITNVDELYKACQENKLGSHRGIKEKLQLALIHEIEAYYRNRSLITLYDAEMMFEQWQYRLKANETLIDCIEILPTGEFRRSLPLLSSLDFLIILKEFSVKNDTINIKDTIFKLTQVDLTNCIKYEGVLSDYKKINLYFTCEKNKYFNLFKTSTPVNFFNDHLKSITEDIQSEEEIFEAAGLPFIPVELREPENEPLLNIPVRINLIPKLVQRKDLKGILHSHTTYSDGIHTMEEMVNACIDRGYSYYGVTDHSKTAAYANGLGKDRLIKQWKHIDELNKQYTNFKIFKGIESDILGDGSLDYDDELLVQFDFIIGSIHSQMNMSEGEATERLIRAVRNPYLSILGHPSGRVYLKRTGYPVDYSRLIDACAEHGTAIELNSNLYRMDLDWKWISYAISQGVKIAITPDAHSILQLDYINQGIKVGRKAFLTQEDILNSMSADELTNWFTDLRKRKLSNFKA